MCAFQLLHHQNQYNLFCYRLHLFWLAVKPDSEIPDAASKSRLPKPLTLSPEPSMHPTTVSLTVQTTRARHTPSHRPLYAHPRRGTRWRSWARKQLERSKEPSHRLRKVACLYIYIYIYLFIYIVCIYILYIYISMYVCCICVCVHIRTYVCNV